MVGGVCAGCGLLSLHTLVTSVGELAQVLCAGWLEQGLWDPRPLGEEQIGPSPAWGARCVGPGCAPRPGPPGVHVLGLPVWMCLGPLPQAAFPEGAGQGSRAGVGTWRWIWAVAVQPSQPCPLRAFSQGCQVPWQARPAGSARRLQRRVGLRSGARLRHLHLSGHAPLACLCSLCPTALGGVSVSPQPPPFLGRPPSHLVLGLPPLPGPGPRASPLWAGFTGLFPMAGNSPMRTGGNRRESLSAGTFELFVLFCEKRLTSKLDKSLFIPTEFSTLHTSVPAVRWL